MNTNFNKLAILLDHLRCINVHIIILTKIWEIRNINKFQNNNIKQLKIQGYINYYNKSMRNQNDGIAIFYIDNLNVNIISFKLNDVTLEWQIFKINTIEFVIAALYRSPASDVDRCLVDFSQYLKDTKSNSTEIILGDLNIDT